MINHSKLRPNSKIILFDGVCNLCNSSINFIIQRDSKQEFLFASLQSTIAKQLCAERNIDTTKIDSIIFIELGQAYYVKSTAILKIARHLGGFYTILSCLLVLPVPFRDSIYNYVAKHRYNWFGKKDSCMVPTKALKARFLES